MLLGLREHRVRGNLQISWGKILFDPNIILYNDYIKMYFMKKGEFYDLQM